jgi:hypothetical protein
MTEGSEAVESEEIPAPLALHDYFRLLDDFASGRPCRNAYIGEMLDARGWADRERTEYEQGQSSLWRLIPPITLEELAEADFDPAAFIALSLAVTLWGRHALHHWSGRMTGTRMPAPLPDIERVSRFVAEHLEQAGRKSNRGAIGRLDALRQDLQAARLELDASARDQTTAADGVQGGIASARKADTPAGVLRWLPRRLRRATAPGLDLLRHAAEVGGPLAMVTGEFARPAEFDVDPQVPPPLGVYDYVQALGDAASGKRMQHVFLHGLMQTVGLSDDLRRRFGEGRNGLWILIPPITATGVAEAQLGADAAAALGVALILRIRHALLHYRPEQPSGKPPPVLAECGEILTAIKLILESGRSGGDDPVLTALTDVAQALARRGVSAGGVVDERLDAIREERRQGAEARREAAAAEDEFTVEPGRVRTNVSLSVVRGARMGRVVIGVLLLVGLGGFSGWLNTHREALPTAASYTDVPAVAIIRHRDEVVVRVPAIWMTHSALEREGALRALYARFAAELGAEAVPVIVVGLKGEPYGGVAGDRVWWEAAPAPTPTTPRPTP